MASMREGVKTSSKHPIIVIEKRVLESPSYAALSFAARAALVELAKALTKGGNGHIFISRDQWERAGFCAKTVTRCIGELIGHGFVYRTRTGGIGRGCSTYALTWLSITRKEGLFLQGFKPCAWRDFAPEPQKTRGTNLPHVRCKNVQLPQSSTPKMSPIPWDKSTHHEVITITSPELVIGGSRP